MLLERALNTELNFYHPCIAYYYGTKRMQQFVKIVRCFFAPYFYENRDALLLFAWEAPGYGIAALFAKRAAFLAKRAAIR